MSKALHIQCFMHADFEGPGVIEDWAREGGHALDYTRFYQDDPLPDASGIDLLVIMGGPMSVGDAHVHPWMEEELGWIRAFIHSGKAALGICLGAQLIASALGADVYPGPEPEIGWFPLQCLPCLGDFKICRDLPTVRKVFHWHGDTFDIPEGAIRIARTKAVPNQGFIYDKRVIALQFHLEVTPGLVEGMLEHCAHEIAQGPYMQSEAEILAEHAPYEANQHFMFRFLDYLRAQAR